MVKLVEEIELGKRGGFGQNIDVSDNLEDMSYAEQFILRPDILDMLAKMQTSVKYTGEDGSERIKGGVLLVDREDLPGYDGEFFTGAANKLNQVFVHLEIPYFASGYTSKDAPTITKKRTKGDDAGTEYNIKPADKIRIVKTGDVYDKNLYAVEGSTKLKPYKNKKDETVTPSAYNEPTEGMKARIDRWISENINDVADVLDKLGLKVEVKG